jgi:hypothetical protein
MAPLFAARSHEVRQVDVHGRNLREFASFKPVDDFLCGIGAPDPGQQRMSPCEPGSTEERGPLSRTDWARCLGPELVSLLEHFGYEEPGTGDPDRLIAHLSPRREFAHALRARDRIRVSALIELGALDGPADLSFSSARTETVVGVSPASMAVLVDGEDGSAEWTALLSHHVSITRRDSRGRTLLHFARNTDTCRFLIDRGVDLAARDHDGRLAHDVVPPACRAEIERAILSSAMAGSCRITAAHRL